MKNNLSPAISWGERWEIAFFKKNETNMKNCVPASAAAQQTEVSNKYKRRLY
jgi:hypothetical protein